MMANPVVPRIFNPRIRIRRLKIGDTATRFPILTNELPREIDSLDRRQRTLVDFGY